MMLNANSSLETIFLLHTKTGGLAGLSRRADGAASTGDSCDEAMYVELKDLIHLYRVNIMQFIRENI